MRMMLVVVCVASLFGGCASNMSEEDRAAQRWAQQIRILEPDQLGDRTYDVLAELEERVRVSAAGEEEAVSEAKRRMRLRAAKVDADAVVMVRCERIIDPNDWDAKTTPTVGCIGYAIRWTDTR